MKTILQHSCTAHTIVPLIKLNSCLALMMIIIIIFWIYSNTRYTSIYLLVSYLSICAGCILFNSIHVWRRMLLVWECTRILYDFFLKSLTIFSFFGIFLQCMNSFSEMLIYEHLENVTIFLLNCDIPLSLTWIWSPIFGC